jgi:hypothetical protein
MEDKLRYPIGKFITPEVYTTDYLSERIQEIADFPALLKKEVSQLSDEQLDTPYRAVSYTHLRAHETEL